MIRAAAAGAQPATTPPAPPSAVVRDEGGRWTIKEGPVRLVSAELDYARLPREAWAKRIALARAAGFNAVTIPVCWALHEPQSGTFAFEGRGDLAYLLDELRRQEMWAIVRAGPWIGGDWGLGGLPPWMLERTRRVRMTDPEFLEAADRWFGALAALLATRQIDDGGALIAVEVDSGPFRDGAVADPSYPVHLQKVLRMLGIRVPVIVSNPANDVSHLHPGPLLRAQARTLSRAVVRLGVSRRWGEPDFVPDRTATVAGLLAGGVPWIDCRMVFGGTNFDALAAEGIPTRYDGGAPVGQTGEVRSAFYALKRWLLWTQSFAPLFPAGGRTTDSIRTENGSDFPVRRFSAQGDEVWVVENPSPQVQRLAIPLPGDPATTGRLTLPPRGLRPVLQRWQLAPDLHIGPTTAWVLDGGTIRGRRLLVVEASTSEPTSVAFLADKQPPVVQLGGEMIEHTSRGLLLRIPPLTNGQIHDYRLLSRPPMHIVAVPPDRFDRTWMRDTAAGRCVLIGADRFVSSGDGAGAGEALEMVAVPGSTVRLYTDASEVAVPTGGRVRFDPSIECWILETTRLGADVSPPPLRNWQQQESSDIPHPLLDDSDWTSYPQPFALERLGGDPASPYVWYRTTLLVPEYETCTLNFEGIGDRMWVFANGTRTRPVDGRRRDEVSFRLPGGRHTIALLVEHEGRDDLAGRGSRIPDHVRKGLRPPARLLIDRPRREIGPWEFSVAGRSGSFSGGTWPPLPEGPFGERRIDNPGPDDMDSHTGYAWYRTPLAVPARGLLEIFFYGADDRARVYLNGVRVGVGEEPGRLFKVSIPEVVPARGAATTHTLSVCVENRHGTGGLAGPAGWRIYDPATSGTDSLVWRMQPGLAGERDGWFVPPAESGEDNGRWMKLSPRSRRTAVRWYRVRFSMPPDRIGAGPLFLEPESLERGMAWLNGHRLGRYRKVAYDSGLALFLPPEWLAGENWLVVAETDAGEPGNARLRWENKDAPLLREVRIRLR